MTRLGKIGICVSTIKMRCLERDTGRKKRLPRGKKRIEKSKLGDQSQIDYLILTTEQAV